MKVLFITRNFPPAVCGVGDYTSKLAHEFAAHSHAVHVLTSQSAISAQESVVVHAVIPQWNVFSIPRILRNCKEIAPDAISIQYVPYSFSNKGIPFWLILLYVLLKVKGYITITTFHEVGIRYTDRNLKRKFTAAAQFFIARFVAKLSVKNITSIDLYVGYLKRYTDEVYKIPIGSNIMPSNATTSELADLRTRIAPNNEFIISSFGTRVSDVILHTLAALKKEGRAVKLLLLGNLPKTSREQFNQIANELNISNDIYITGYLEEHALYNHLNLSSLFVMAEFVSPKGEGGIAAKSGSLAAAFAAGLSILGTKGDTTDAVFADNENIFLMEDYSIASTQKRITEIMQDKHKRDVVAQQSRKTFEDYFSWEKIFKKYINVFNSSIH